MFVHTETVVWVLLGIAIVLALAWYLSYSAARLDRLHAKVEGALSALDASVVRRGEAALELVNSGGLDPASALLVAQAATDSLALTNERALADDLLEGQRFAGRESAESQLTESLAAALDGDGLSAVRSSGAVAGDAVNRLAEATMRLQLARRFHNEAVKEVQRFRRKPVVRLFRLAGHATMPHTVEFDDTWPEAAGPVLPASEASRAH
jgi:hypothetical protein